MAIVLVLHEHKDARERLRRAASIEAAAGCRHEVHFVSDWCELSILDTRRHIVRVVDAYRDGNFGLAQLREVSETNRVHPIVVYSDFKGRPAAEILRLSQLGIAHVISQDIDDKVTEIRAMLSGALRGTARSRIFAALEEHICPDAAVLLHEMWVVGNSSGAAGCSGCLHRPG